MTKKELLEALESVPDDYEVLIKIEVIFGDDVKETQEYESGHLTINNEEGTFSIWGVY